jgi:hypothetical protein
MFFMCDDVLVALNGQLPEGSWIGSLFPRVREADFSHGTNLIHRFVGDRDNDPTARRW